MDGLRALLCAEIFLLSTSAFEIQNNYFVQVFTPIIWSSNLDDSCFWKTHFIPQKFQSDGPTFCSRICGLEPRCEAFRIDDEGCRLYYEIVHTDSALSDTSGDQVYIKVRSTLISSVNLVLEKMVTGVSYPSPSYNNVSMIVGNVLCKNTSPMCYLSSYDASERNLEVDLEQDFTVSQIIVTNSRYSFQTNINIYIGPQGVHTDETLFGNLTRNPEAFEKVVFDGKKEGRFIYIENLSSYLSMCLLEAFGEPIV